MVDDTSDNPELRLSLRRRFAALRPHAERALSHAGPPPSEATVKQYEAAVERMVARRQWPEQIGRNSRGSYNLNRAGLVYSTREKLRAAYQCFIDQADAMSVKRTHRLLNIIEQCLSLLERYPPGARDEESRWRQKSRWRCPKAERTRKSKRRGLGRLPLRWREIMLSACPPGSPYHEAMLVLALTGLRPAELAKGVLVQAVAGGVRVSIRGAKVTEQAGQPLRQIWLKAGGWIVRGLLARVAAAGRGSLVVSIADPRAFCDFVRGLSRRLFPQAGYVVTPYSFRHAFSADQKAAGVTAVVLGKLLGHVSARSQRAYGVRRQGGHAIARVLGVAAVRPVRQVTSRYRDVRRVTIHDLGNAGAGLSKLLASYSVSHRSASYMPYICRIAGQATL